MSWEGVCPQRLAPCGAFILWYDGNMEKRFSKILNLEQYQEINEPLTVGEISTNPDSDAQMVLRMLVESPYSEGLKLPPELFWVSEIIEKAKQFQKEKIKISHPFVYVTIRHGNVVSQTDDEWHVDGFSMRYNHLPEANYILVMGKQPTQFIRQSFNFPRNFNPLKHNIHSFFQKRVDESKVFQLDSGILYFIDPYVVHRRPPSTHDSKRTFVRVSFTPIEIVDINNTANPLIETRHYNIDGIKEFRGGLRDYDEI